MVKQRKQSDGVMKLQTIALKISYPFYGSREGI